LKRPSRSRFFPLATFDSGATKAHGRIEWRRIEVLPAQAADITQEWPTVSQICRVTRSRQRRVKGVWQEPQQETAYLITSLTKDEASPEYLLNLNRKHWGIEIMHRNKDVMLGEDGYTNRFDNAPQNIFSLTGFALKVLRCVSPSPTRAIEHFQDNRSRATQMIATVY
jgi:predicted transposase YbfD/YdcC